LRCGTTTFNRDAHVRVLTTLAVAAKNIMTSVPTYIQLETGFTLLQFLIVGPMIALAYRN
jgi:hypothetical protein